MNDLVLVESQVARDEFVDRVDVLRKVKQMSLLPDDLHITVQMAANFYEVSTDAIRKIISLHREELEADEIIVLKGQAYSEYFARDEISLAKFPGFNHPKARTATLLPRRAVLRIGMLLRDSVVAKQVRQYLLDKEQESKSTRMTTIASDEKSDTLHWLAENVKLILQVFANNAECLTAISNLYQYAGIPLLPVSAEDKGHQVTPKLALVNRESERWYSCEAIARHIGLLSITKKPHIQLVAALIRTFKPILGVDAKLVQLDDKGTEVTAYRYTLLIATKVTELLQSLNWPNSIKVSGKVYQVFYEKHPDNHQFVEIG